MVHIGNLVTAADNLTLQSRRPGVTGVAENAVADFVGQIQTFSVFFQHIHNPETLLVMAERLSQTPGQSHFTGMAERGMSQVMAHGNGFRQVFVEAKGTGNGGGNPGNLQSVGHAGTVVVAFRLQKHLGLVHETAEGLGMHYPVNIPLITGAHIPVPFFFHPWTACGLIRKSSQRI